MTSLQCPDCQAENSLESKYCSSCGHLFKGEPTTVLGPPVTSPAVGGGSATPDAVSAEFNANGLLPADSVLQDRYRITQLLGQGGMGAVYLAQDTRFASRTCVIKEMLDHFSDPEQRAQATESFHREADFLATLKHSGIPEVYDRFTEANRHYLVMEYINGVDLEQRLIDNGGPFTEKEVIGWMIQCCDVLSYLHHQKPPIIYRDMKPANVITTSWGKVSLVDFGIARFFNPVSRGTMIGTQGYAPPEQYRGQVEPRSDIYALGATMHYLLTGRDPQNEPPFSFPPVKTLNPEISDEMEMMILKALDPEVENRFASADEMLGQLMAHGGDATDVVRECPHCGKMSSITRQFCPHCKQYISKKAHVLNPKNGSGHLTDAAGQHQNKSANNTRRFDEPGVNGATATNLAVPTGRTEFTLYSIKKPLTYAGIAAVAVAVLAVGVTVLNKPKVAGLSMGEAVLTSADKDKEEGVKAFAAGHYAKAIQSFTMAVKANPADGEARIYRQNAYVLQSKAPSFKLAIAGPFSGEFQAKGEAQLQGAAFAQERINSDGSQKVKLLLQLADDGSSIEGAVSISTRVADLSDVAGVVGHIDSDASMAALPVYGLAGQPVITPTSTSPELTNSAPNLFRLSPDDTLQGAALARYVTGGLHAKKLVVVASKSNSHSQGLSSAFINQAEAAGAQVTKLEFDPKDDLAKLADQVKSRAPEAIFLAGSHLDAVKFAQVKAGAGVSAPLVGGDALYLPELLEKGGGAVNGLICSTYYHSRLGGPMATQFEKDFQGKVGHEANSRAALTYEAVELFAAASKDLGPDRKSLSTYLKNLGQNGFEGLSGHAGLDAKGNVRRPMYLMKVQDGRFKPLTQVDL